MTDNEIIKALECCHKQYCPNCEICPNEKTCEEIDVVDSVIDLINRQKVEIERLQKEIESLNKEYPCTVKMNDYCLVYARSLDDYDNLIKTTKSEAIKEFAERLKEKADRGYWQEHFYVDIEDIDELVKEMMESEEKDNA